MNTKRLLPIAVHFFMTAAAFCRDFPEPFPGLDPLHSAQSSGITIMPRSYAEIGYCPHVFHSSSADSFDVRGLASFTLIDIDSTFALNLRWGSYLLVGPLAEGDTAATVAKWWMNAAQYEYGLTAAYAIFGTHALLEYSRTSQHPWRDAFSQVTTDTIKCGLAIPPIIQNRLTLEGRIMTGYLDLFDFWESSVSKPRTFWITSPALHVSYRLNAPLSLFMNAQLDTLLLRSDGVDADLWAELGIEAGRGASRIQLYLDFFSSKDTEELDEGPSPATLFGFGLRLSAQNN